MPIDLHLLGQRVGRDRGGFAHAQDMTAADSVVRVDRCKCRCWACPGCAHRMGNALYWRLRGRLMYERIVMVTFTLNPSFAGFKGSPREAWEYVRRNRSISRAINAWADSKGLPDVPYFCKAELQGNGWLHWHILLVVPDGMTFEKLGEFDQFWTLGFSNVQQNVNLHYITKYVAKGQDHIDAIMASGLPGKGIRFTSCSRGFWGIGRKPKSDIAWADDNQESLPDDAAEFDVSALESEAGAEEAVVADQMAESELLYIKVICCGNACQVTVTSVRENVKPFSVRLPFEAGTVCRELIAVGALEDGESRGTYWQTDLGRAFGMFDGLPFTEDSLYVEVLETFLSWSVFGVSAPE